MIKYLTYLMAPADALGGGGAAVADDNPPNSLGDFMSGLGSLEETTTEKKTEDKPNGDAATKPSGDSNAAGANNDKQAAGTADAAKTGANANADKSDTGADKTASDKSVADKAAADKSGATDSKSGATEDDKWPRSSSDWETFKTRRQQEREKAKAELAARDAQIAELQGKVKTFEETSSEAGKENPETKAELERLTKLNTELSEQIRILDVTQHPKWKAYFGEKEKEQIELANDILGAEKGKKFAEIVAIPDTPGLNEYKKASMQEFMSDLTTFEQSAIANVTAEMMRIDRQKKAEIKKNEEHIAQLKTSRDGNIKQQTEARQKLFLNTVAQMTDPKSGLAVFKKQEGNEEWNKQVDSLLAGAKRLYFGAEDLKADEVARAAMHAAAMPTFLKAWESDLAAKDKEIATLQEQVKRLQSATPGGLRGGGDEGGEGQGGSARKRVEPGMTPEQATAQLVKSWSME